MINLKRIILLENIVEIWNSDNNLSFVYQKLKKNDYEIMFTKPCYGQVFITKLGNKSIS